MKRKKLWELFCSFAKIGAFTFGGGYVMISLISQECVEKKKWLTHDEMTTVMAVAESTPGPIAMNCATYTGYQQAGLMGAAVATLGLVLPSFVVIYIISLFLDNFLAITWIANAFKGIKIGVGVLILQAGLNMLRKMKRKKPLQLGIVAAAAGILLTVNCLALRLSTLWLMLGAAVLSVSLYAVQRRKGAAL